VTGVDTSPDALELAAENAERLGLAVELRPGGVETAAEGWDLVVANPPYVSQGALTDPQPELLWEPRQALLDVGLHDEIARAAVTRWLVFEVGDGQADSVAKTLGELGYADIRITNDLSGRARVVEGRRS
jgi:release factor glutamine methyltransferase